MENEQCIEIIRGRLKESRFIHSLAVADEAKRLAEKYGADVEKAYKAGLLHDIMKNAPESEQLEVMKRNGAEPTEDERTEPKLFHAIAGACYIKEQGICADEEIIRAVRYHTTGRAGMSLLEKILYVADFTSAERDYDGVQIMREVCNVSLEAAMLEGTRYTIASIAERCSVLHIDTVLMYNELVRSPELKDFKPKIKL